MAARVCVYEGASHDNSQELCSNVRAARLRARLKIAEVSERTGIRLDRISLIEHGRLTVTTQNMGTMAEAVERPLSTLLEAGIEFVEGDVGS